MKIFKEILEAYISRSYHLFCRDCNHEHEVNEPNFNVVKQMAHEHNDKTGHAVFFHEFHPYKEGKVHMYAVAEPKKLIGPIIFKKGITINQAKDSVKKGKK